VQKRRSVSIMRVGEWPRLSAAACIAESLEHSG
jgi:hypothetical protein